MEEKQKGGSELKEKVVKLKEKEEEGKIWEKTIV